MSESMVPFPSQEMPNQTVIEKPTLSKAVFVSNLPVSLTEEELKEVFGEFGTITTASLQKRQFPGMSSYLQGYIVYNEAWAADLAIKTMDKTQFNNKQISVYRNPNMEIYTSSHKGIGVRGGIAENLKKWPPENVTRVAKNQESVQRSWPPENVPAYVKAHTINQGLPHDGKKFQPSIPNDTSTFNHMNNKVWPKVYF